MARPFEGLKRKDDRHEPNKPELVLMAVSVIVTLSLFGYVAWHAWVTPENVTPEARVLGFTPTDEGVLATVELTNPGGSGLISVEVTVDCDEPAPAVGFTNVPASGRRTGHVMCPLGTTQANATIESFVEA